MNAYRSIIEYIRDVKLGTPEDAIGSCIIAGTGNRPDMAVWDMELDAWITKFGKPTWESVLAWADLQYIEGALVADSIKSDRHEIVARLDRYAELIRRQLG